MFIFVIHYNITIFNKGLEITYIDVGQGDSIFIKFPNDKSNILIDTGGKVTYGNLKNNYTNLKCDYDSTSILKEIFLRLGTNVI